MNASLSCIQSFESFTPFLFSECLKQEEMEAQKLTVKSSHMRKKTVLLTGCMFVSTLDQMLCDVYVRATYLR